jgi:hypothetical protein
MMAITTLALVKQHLRYDSDDENDLLDAYRQAAESAVFSYVTDTFVADANTGKVTYPTQFIQAVLLLCGYYDKYRNIDGEMPSDGNYLPPPVRALLYPFRSPTVV